MGPIPRRLQESTLAGTNWSSCQDCRHCVAYNADGAQLRRFIDLNFSGCNPRPHKWGLGSRYYILARHPFVRTSNLSRQSISQEEMNARLFGFEGYLPIEKIEEKLWGSNLGNLKWSAYGSTLSRHKSGKPSSEAAFNMKSGLDSSDSNGQHTSRIETYPVVPLDPVVDEDGSDEYSRQTLASLKERAERLYGNEKVC